MRYILIMFLFTFTILRAEDTNINIIANKLGLYAGTKAIIQWERIFSSDRRMKKHILDTLQSNEIKKLKIYLIEHAADSDQPVVPGL